MYKQLLLLPALGLALSTDAQTALGAKAGFNYHFQSVALGDEAPSGAEDPVALDGTGFHVGAFASFALSDHLYVRPELLYSTRTAVRNTLSSTTMGSTTTAIDTRTENALTYLEVPLMMGLRLSDRFSLQAGPAAGFLLRSKTTVTGTQTVTDNGQAVVTSLDSETISTKGLRTTEIAVVAGLGYRMTNGLDLGLRYWRGLTTLEEETDLTKTHQNLVQVSVGYAFLKDRPQR